MQPTTLLAHRKVAQRISDDIERFLAAGGQIKGCSQGESGDKSKFGNPLSATKLTKSQRKKRQKKFNDHM
jgi:hypothetical protein